MREFWGLWQVCASDGLVQGFCWGWVVGSWNVILERGVSGRFLRIGVGVIGGYWFLEASLACFFVIWAVALRVLLPKLFLRVAARWARALKRSTRPSVSMIFSSPVK